MNKKIIATLVALGMVVTAFAMVAPVKAASPHTWHFLDFGGFNLRIRDTVSDGMSPDDGVCYWVDTNIPGEYNDDVSGDLGTPWPGMSAWIGLNGRSGGSHYVMVQTSAAASEPSTGDDCIFFLEKDAGVAALPNVYFADGTETGTGNVPDGHIWAGRDTLDMAIGDQEVSPSGTPPTTFFELLDMPAPDLSGAPSITWAGVTGGADVEGDTNAEIVNWHLYEGPAANDDNGPWTSVGTAAFGNPIAYAVQPEFWYSVRVEWNFGIMSTVLSTPEQAPGGGSDFAPEATALLSTPAVHDGNIASESVTITATITESAADSDPNFVIAAEFRVDGGTPIAMTAVDGGFGGEASEDVTGTFNFPNGFTEGVHTFEVRGQDDGVNPGDGWNGTWASGTFTVTDTTAPVADFTLTPSNVVYVTSATPFVASYGDFCAMDFTVTESYLSYSVNNGSWNDVAWNNGSFAWGSYTNILTYTFPGSTFAIGDWVEWTGQVTDSSAAGNVEVFATSGAFEVFDAPAGVQDPYVVYGRAYLYDGAAGVYAPMLSAGGATVTVSWMNSTTAAWSSIATTTNALGQYSVDILNYTDGDVNGIEVSAVFDAPYGNNGYNNTILDIGVNPGGVEQNVVCGVPYEVVITAPLPLSNQVAGIGFNAIYQILDRDGALAQGYFSFADGDMEWYSNDPAFVPPALENFDGTASATPGTATDFLTLFTGPTAWINITEGGAAELNNFPTPWGAFTQQIAGVTSDGWLDDYDNITVNVQVGGFDWYLVQGWNMVSVPQDPVDKGLVAGFDARDALNNCWWQTLDNNLALADRTGPSTYVTNDLTTPEAGAFPLDGVHAYWVWYELAAPAVVHFNATNYSTSVWDGTNWVMSVNAVAGWNLLGFTHNYSAWTTVPTASMFTDGTVDAALATGVGGNDKIIATQWNYGSQWYHSYVETTTFPGMAVHNWAWDFTYSGQPGNGYFLYLEAATTIDYNVNF